MNVKPSGPTYRVSEGVLLKRAANGLIWALVKGRWSDYHDVEKDWFTNSRLPHPGEVERFFGGLHLAEAAHDVSGEARDHGKFAKTPGSGTRPPMPSGNVGVGAENLAAQLRVRGGFTYQRVADSVPKKGFAFSESPQYERSMRPSECTKQVIQKYLDDHAHVFKSDPKASLGACLDKEKGLVYLDISTVVDDKEEAVRIAHQHGQEGIYDLAAGTTIITKRADQLRGVKGFGARPIPAGCDGGRNSSGDAGVVRGPPDERSGQRRITESLPDETAIERLARRAVELWESKYP